MGREARERPRVEDARHDARPGRRPFEIHAVTDSSPPPKPITGNRRGAWVHHAPIVRALPSRHTVAYAGAALYATGVSTGPYGGASLLRTHRRAIATLRGQPRRSNAPSRSPASRAAPHARRLRFLRNRVRLDVSRQE